VVAVPAVLISSGAVERTGNHELYVLGLLDGVKASSRASSHQFRLDDCERRQPEPAFHSSPLSYQAMATMAASSWRTHYQHAACWLPHSLTAGCT
jgi:hypothetical protein